MKLLLFNNSSDSFSYLSNSVVIPSNGELDVSSTYWFSLYTEPDFIKDIRLNNILVGDGVKTLQYPESENYLKFINEFNYNNKDIDGAVIVRHKAARKGWSFLSLPPEITTSTIGGSLYCKDSSGNDITGISCKIYNSNNDEITTPGLENANLSTCVKTILDVELPFDYELIGGALRVTTSPSDDIRLWIIGAPDIPSQYGGSKEFASGINLKFLSADNSFDIDGRVAKFITYNPATHQGKLRILLKHAAGLTVNMQVMIHLYRL